TLLRPATHDVLVRRVLLLAGPRLGLAPRADRVAAAGGLALAAAERMIDRVHGHAAGLGTNTLPAVATGLAQLDQLGLGVSDLADGGAAVERHHTHLSGRQPEEGHVVLLGHELDRRAGRAGQLGPTARTHLDGVDHGSGGDVAEGKGVPGPDIGVRAGSEDVAGLHTHRGQDVSLLAVHVVEEGDTRIAVGVVFDPGHLGGHAVLVAAEVDDPIPLLVTPAAMAGGDPTVGVAASGRLLLVDERLLGLGLGDLREVGDRLEPAPGRGRLALLDCHLRLQTGRSSLPRRA